MASYSAAAPLGSSVPSTQLSTSGRGAYHEPNSNLNAIRSADPNANPNPNVNANPNHVDRSRDHDQLGRDARCGEVCSNCLELMMHPP